MADKFVDASVNSDGGAGTRLDPWTVTAGNNVIQKMLDNTTQGTSGDTCHIKITGTAVDFSGTDLDFTSYTVSSATQPLVISAYETAAWDVTGSDSLALIDLNGASTFVASTVIGLTLFNLDISGGTGPQLNADDHIHVWHCKITGQLTVNSSCSVVDCEVTNSITTAACIALESGMVMGNFVTQPAASSGITINGVSGRAFFNIIKLTAISTVSRGISVTSDGPFVFGNMIHSTVANTGDGIQFNSAVESGCALNNYVEGFSGAAGNGYNLVAAAPTTAARNNRWFNCTGNTFDDIFHELDNSELSESGFIDAANDNFHPTAELIRAGFPSGFRGTDHKIQLPIGAIQMAKPNIFSVIKRMV